VEEGGRGLLYDKIKKGTSKMTTTLDKRGDTYAAQGETLLERKGGLLLGGRGGATLQKQEVTKEHLEPGRRKKGATPAKKKYTYHRNAKKERGKTFKKKEGPRC